jgi:hypothetical protein
MEIASAQAEPATSGHRGGPRTPVGKERSRRNSIKHGLCATELLSSLVKPGRVQELAARFSEDYSPVTETQRVLVAEAARHAAALEFTQDAEGAVLRQGASQVELLVPGGDSDAALTAAVSSEALDRCARYRRGHEKALHAALVRLRETMTTGRPGPAHKKAPAQPALTETDCVAFLERRFQDGDFRCRRCGSPRGFWIVARRIWQCRDCRHQAGLRTGTIMARSRLPLRLWFAGIQCLAAEPGLTHRELGEKLCLSRAATVRALAKRIRAALATPEMAALLRALEEFSANRVLGCSERPK